MGRMPPDTREAAPDGERRRWLARLGVLAAGCAGLAQAACGGGKDDAPPPTRTWRMGFSALPPRPVVQVVLDGVNLWSQRAELMVIHEDIPWAKLLDGVSPQQILQDEKVQLVDYCRGKMPGMHLYFTADCTDGLARNSEASALRDRSKSLADADVQAVHRAYVQAVVDILKPDYLGLAAETNLVRAAAPPALYQAVRAVSAQSAADVAGAPTHNGGTVVPFVSVQVEFAWGKLVTATPFQGVAQDRTDFPFARALGLSSYPYFGYAAAADIPDDYYSRVVASFGGATPIPAFVAEGGWPSQGATANGVVFTSDAARQAAYIARHAQLLDSIDAIAYLQIPFADFDLTQFPTPQPANLPLFATLGLTDDQFVAKPALAEWDKLFARRRL